jgi:hypothetical protein
MVSRRSFFWLILAGSVCLGQSVAFAENGGGNSGSGNSGSNNSGSGSNNSGSGNSGNDDDDYDSDDYKAAQDAVKNSNAASLREILTIVRQHYDGEVVRVSVRGTGTGLTYHIKMLNNNRLIEVQINAVSRRIMRTKGT